MLRVASAPCEAVWAAIFRGIGIALCGRDQFGNRRSSCVAGDHANRFSHWLAAVIALCQPLGMRQLPRALAKERDNHSTDRQTDFSELGVCIMPATNRLVTRRRNPLGASRFLSSAVAEAARPFSRRILNAHSRVAIPPESLFVYEFLAAERVPLEKRKRLLCVDPAFEAWGIERAIELFTDCDTMAACIERIHEEYAAANGKHFWGHKTPTLVQHAEFLAKVMPDAPIHSRCPRFTRDCELVEAIRCPPHECADCQPVLQRSYGVRAEFGGKPFRSNSARNLRGTGQRAEQVVPPLCAWLGLEFEEAMIASGDADTLQLNATEEKFSHHRNVRRPIDPSLCDKWKKELDQREIDLATWMTRETMQRAGYSIDEPANRPSSAYKALLRLQHVLMATYMMIRNLWSRPHLFRIVRRQVAIGIL